MNITDADIEIAVRLWLELRNVSEVSTITGHSPFLIRKWLEKRELLPSVICDYCSVSIPKGRRKKYGTRENLENGVTVGFYFCSKECLKKWVDNE